MTFPVTVGFSSAVIDFGTDVLKDCAVCCVTRQVKTHFFHNSYFAGLRQMQSAPGSGPDEKVTHLRMKLQYTSTTTHPALVLGAINPLQHPTTDMLCIFPLR